MKLNTIDLSTYIYNSTLSTLTARVPLLLRHESGQFDRKMYNVEINFKEVDFSEEYHHNMHLSTGHPISKNYQMELEEVQDFIIKYWEVFDDLMVPKPKPEPRNEIDPVEALMRAMQMMSSGSSKYLYHTPVSNTSTGSYISDLVEDK